MLNEAAFRMIFEVPTLTINPVEVKPDTSKYAVKSKTNKDNVIEALKGSALICFREITNITGITNSGLRYIVGNLQKQGRVTSRKIKADGKKPVHYFTWVGVTCH